VRVLEILALSNSLLGEASRHSDCVNGGYLQVHRIIAEALNDNPELTKSKELHTQLSGRLLTAMTIRAAA
jgi:hypothetical protein